MKSNNFKLYNLVFPIWLLLLIPLTWFVVLPVNFLIDLLVVVLTLKFMKLQNVKSISKSVIFRVFIFGFIADLIGALAMFMVYVIDIVYKAQLGEWWNDNILDSVCFDPFKNIYGVLWVTMCVLIAAFFIYLFNYKFCLKKANLDDNQKKKLALSLAVFTAPYLFYLPTSWFFKSY